MTETKPKAIELLITDAHGTPMIQCPVCGNADEIQCFDVLGADEGCVFCNECNTEIEWP